MNTEEAIHLYDNSDNPFMDMNKIQQDARESALRQAAEIADKDNQWPKSKAILALIQKGRQ